MRAETAALLAAAYMVAMFVWHRLRLLRRRAAGPSLELLRRFDYRAVWDELLPSLPDQPGAPAPQAGSPTAPRFFAQSPWELDEPFARRVERDALKAGAVPAADAREPEAAWLFVHFAVRRIFEGDLDGAEAIAERLEEGQAGRLLATIELARAERAASIKDLPGARKAALAALTRVRALEREVGASPGLSYLSAHLRLAWLTHEVNLEWSVGAALVTLRRALRRFGDLPPLYLSLAHAQALLGRHEEALDELGRAVYYARGDAFYSRAVLEDGFVFRTRPALAAQCKGAGATSPPVRG
jgi:tetratricopeptide (TPR) repeat protein